MIIYNSLKTSITKAAMAEFMITEDFRKNEIEAYACFSSLTVVKIIFKIKTEL